MKASLVHCATATKNMIQCYTKESLREILLHMKTMETRRIVKYYIVIIMLCGLYELHYILIKDINTI